jgi:hypothetical protein
MRGCRWTAETKLGREPHLGTRARRLELSEHMDTSYEATPTVLHEQADTLGCQAVYDAREGPRSADLPRRRLRDEQVRALDRSAEDGPDMALRGRRSSSPGPRRRPKSMAVAGTDPRCDASGATLICKKFVNRAQGFQASGIFHRGGQEPRRGERGTVCDGRLAAKCALALAATSDYLRPVVSLTARSGYRPRSWGGRSRWRRPFACADETGSVQFEDSSACLARPRKHGPSGP